MELTYILVDFENVQPTDMGLLSREHCQLRIFRGPHQNKLGFDIVESLHACFVSVEQFGSVFFAVLQYGLGYCRECSTFRHQGHDASLIGAENRGIHQPLIVRK